MKCSLVLVVVLSVLLRWGNCNAEFNMNQMPQMAREEVAGVPLSHADSAHLSMTKDQVALEQEMEDKMMSEESAQMHVMAELPTADEMENAKLLQEPGMQRLARQLRQFHQIRSTMARVPNAEEEDNDDDADEDAIAEERAVRRRKRVRRRNSKNKLKRRLRNKHVSNRKKTTRRNIKNKNNTKRKNKRRSSTNNSIKRRLNTRGQPSAVRRPANGLSTRRRYNNANKNGANKRKISNKKSKNNKKKRTPSKKNKKSKRTNKNKNKNKNKTRKQNKDTASDSPRKGDDNEMSAPVAVEAA